MINWRLENIEDGDMIPGFAVFDDSEQYGAGAVVAYIPQKYHHHGHLITAAPALLRALHDVMLEHAHQGWNLMEPRMIVLVKPVRTPMKLSSRQRV